MVPVRPYAEQWVRMLRLMRPNPIRPTALQYTERCAHNNASTQADFMNSSKHHRELRGHNSKNPPRIF